MNPISIVRAIVYPLAAPAVLVPLIVFWVLVSFASWGGVLGLFLMFLILPAIFRFQMIVLEARARGAEPATPDVEFFNWFGHAWTLFPVVVSLAVAWAVVTTLEHFGMAWAVVVVMLASALLPASFSVLAITRSPLQSLYPVAIFRLLERTGSTLWIATAFLIVSCFLSYLAEDLPAMLTSLAQLFLTFSFFSLTGSLIEPYDLFGEVDIPAPLEKTAAEVSSDIEKERVAALAHAYGFISRDNREGGFKHLLAEIGKDPDPVAAWAWYFDNMLRWEQQHHALFFAQHYIHDMLTHGERIPALKVIMRCRLIDEQFKPLPEDMPAAVQAAENSGNIELAAVLKQL
jgi:hypothetical protein